MLGKGDKKHCFLVEGLYNYYKTQTESNLPVRNPVDSSSRLTELEVKSLIKKMKKINYIHRRKNIVQLSADTLQKN